MINETDLEAWDYWNESQPDTLEDYQDFVESVILTEGPNRLAENALGLVGESGEVAEKVKKYFRGDGINHEEVKKELGDAFFYMVALANYFDFNFYDIIHLNREKLESRRDRGVLRGSGDNR